MNPNTLSDNQILVARSKARFRVLASGRRFGKTYLAIYELARAAAFRNRTCWYVAPSYRQAKQIAWKMLKETLNEMRWWAKFNESELTATLKQSGSVISLKGADNYDTLRGVGIHFLVIDEAADVKPEAWSEVLRPTLSDTGGEALFIGTPKGRNWFYDLYMRGKHEPCGCDSANFSCCPACDPEWEAWQFTTVEGGNVPAQEIEMARCDLDELTFNQEYLASFVNFQGRAYYPFSLETHVSEIKYDPVEPLNLCFDFNVEPGICIAIQETTLPNGLIGSAVVGEVYIKRNSNTPAVCRKVVEMFGEHKGVVTVFGDSTGGARGTAKVVGSDWDLIRQELRPVFKERFRVNVPSSNPRERVRVNAVNSRLKSHTGDIRLMVDSLCKNTIRDFEGVQLLDGGAGEIDKKIAPMLTHITDAIGYYINVKFPVVQRSVTVSGISND